MLAGKDRVAREAEFAKRAARAFDDADGHDGARVVFRELHGGGVDRYVEIPLGEIEPAHPVGPGADLRGGEGKLVGLLREALAGGADHVVVKRGLKEGGAAGENDVAEQRARAFHDGEEQPVAADLVFHRGFREPVLSVKRADIKRRVIRADGGDSILLQLANLLGDGRAELVRGEGLVAREIEFVLRRVFQRPDQQIRSGERAGDIFIGGAERCPASEQSARGQHAGAFPIWPRTKTPRHQGEAEPVDPFVPWCLRARLSW